MAANQCASVSENGRCYLNHLHPAQNGIECLLGGWKTARSRSVLKRESGLAFYCGKVSCTGVTRTENR